MPEDNHADANDGVKSNENKKASNPGLRTIVAAASFAVLALVGVAFLYIKESERVGFIAVNSLSLLVLVVITIQAYTYRRQWDAMQGQLDAMKEQARLMGESIAQNERAVKAAEENVRLAKSAALSAMAEADNQRMVVQQQLALTREQLDQNARAVVASEAQAIAYQASTKATEESVEIARKAFHVGERAYIGIKAMKIGAINIGVKPVIEITYINAGKTPALHFSAWFIGLIVGTRPDDIDDIWTVNELVSDIGNSFVPAGKELTIVYAKTDTLFTNEFVAKLDRANFRLFVFGDARFTDISGERQHLRFCGVYDRESGRFSDYYVE